MKNLLILISFVLLSSCSGYIKELHAQLDGEKVVAMKKEEDKFDFYRMNKSKRMNSKHSKRVSPKVKRKYRSANQFANNILQNSENEGSLWSEKNQDSYLFSFNKKRSIGDIIIINVEKSLKDKIVRQLKSTILLNASKKKKNSKNGKAAAKPSEPAAEGKDDNQPTIYDKIPGIIIEKVNDNHSIVKGRKEILFRKRQRLVEIEGLIKNTSITDENTIISSSFIDQKVKVIR